MGVKKRKEKSTKLTLTEEKQKYKDEGAESTHKHWIDWSEHVAIFWSKRLLKLNQIKSNFAWELNWTKRDHFGLKNTVRCDCFQWLMRKPSVCLYIGLCRCCSAASVMSVFLKNFFIEIALQGKDLTLIKQLVLSVILKKHWRLSNL